jgi:hypothetical protein
MRNQSGSSQIGGSIERDQDVDAFGQRRLDVIVRSDRSSDGISADDAISLHGVYRFKSSLDPHLGEPLPSLRLSDSNWSKRVKFGGEHWLQDRAVKPTLP